MRPVLWGLLLLLACSSVNASAMPEEEVRTLPVGAVEMIDLEFTPAPNPLVGNKTILDVSIGFTPRQLKMVALKKGTTSVYISQEDGKIARRLVYNVIGSDLSVKVSSIRRLLQDVEGITVEAEDDKIVIDGELLTKADRLRVDKVVGAYPDVLDLTTMSKLVR